MATVIHDSDCALHNAPALPVGPCDCGAAEMRVTDFLAPPLTKDEELAGLVAEAIYGRDGPNNAIACDEDQFHACLLAANAVVQAVHKRARQPIETAPKDGTNIIVICPYGGISVARWCERAKAWRGQSFDGDAIQSQGDWGTDYQESSTVTHWMPIPSQPEPTP